ncbi:MAG: hypothetical protein M3R00_02295 [Pseudomonadota bacterium]|nr:hypothetical protein [Pseudomonadota bacterium]
MKLRQCVLPLLMVLATDAFGKDMVRHYFLGCHPVGFSYANQDVVLNPVIVDEIGQTVYLLHNKSPYAIQVMADRIIDGSMVPALTSQINGDNWGAFAVHQPGFALACFSEQGARVSCQNVLEVCQYPRAKFTLANRGTYWLSRNKSKYAARDDVVRKGILLRNWYPGWQSASVEGATQN